MEDRNDFCYVSKFGMLPIGEEFECYGDVHLNYDYPKICRCVKDSENTGKEIDGSIFSMNKSDSIFVKEMFK
jgi:hypothetical protein